MLRRQIRAFTALATVALAHPVAAQEAAAWKLTGSVDAGFVSATGNTQITTMSLGDKLAATYAHWTLRQFVAYVYGQTKGVESANQLHLGARTEYALSDRFSAFASAAYERNPFAGFNRRIDEQLGAQWKALRAPEDSVTVDAGGLLTQQDNTDGTTDASPSARAALAWKHVFKTNTFFTQQVEYLPNVRESGAYRLNTETAALAPISARISLKLSYVVQYNSRPPDSFGTTDRVFTSGLQISF